ncbi:MAG: STAS domain-containing protein [Gammaproteobacteria bacterium]|nr:STAS domain-containing protein [Gammaproteobacteria bacterium]
MKEVPQALIEVRKKKEDEPFQKDSPICFEWIGVLTHATVPSLWEGRNRFFEKQSPVIFDLKGLERTDSAGVAFFASLLREAREKRISIQFTNLPQQFIDIAHLVGLEVLFGTPHRSE